ncbi:MAG: FIST C-terminal domain-containing protein [Oscillospiraceae bacterium]|jgi:hypothetical protein|nr:FIST C-terminal domain-containing protein [Oscillospiraceae bacterium]
MIKSYVITVSEIDEPKDAVAEVREKLADVKLLKNTVGIVSVHAEYFQSGVYGAVADCLPFELAGISTTSLSANGDAGTYMFSILILTSDDCRFSCGHTDSLAEGDDVFPAVKKCYGDLRERLGEQPKLALMYAPLMATHIPGEYMGAIAEIDPKVPIFGAVANSGQTMDEILSYCRVLCGNEILYPAVAFVLIAGEFTPEFFVGSLTEDAVIMPNVGEITKANKNVLVEINGVKSADFFEKIGFGSEGGTSAGLLTSTFILDFNKKPAYGQGVVSRAPLMIDGENGILCAGSLHEGAILSVAFSTPDVVIQTANGVIEKIKEKEDISAVLIYSCIGRRLGLMSEHMKEIESVNDNMPEGVNYTLCYVSGELCPIAVAPEKAYNHEHNQTIIACAF